MEEIIPIIIYENSPVILKYGHEEAKKAINQFPIELRGFFEKFKEIIVAPSADEAIITLDKDALFSFPHFFFIFSEREKFTENQIITIRRYIDSVLSPLFISINLYDAIMEIVDGVFKGFSEAMIKKSEEIWEIIDKFDPNPYAASLPENRRVSYIRFLTTRKTDEEKPILQKDSIKGFFYPKAYFILKVEEKGKELEELEILKTQKILSSDIANKTSLCPYCEHYNLIFREVCPACGSVRIKLVEFIHHYSCGYIGPVDEFIQGNKLVCPKCHEELKHIGVDYDKPLEKYLCEDCGNRFLEPDIDVLCANCKKKMGPEDVKSEFIHKFTLTPFGKLVSFEGRLPINVFEEVTVSLGVVNFNAFVYILDKFIKINNRYPDRKFCTLAIFFSIPDSTISELPLRIRTFLKDLIQIIKDNIRESDIISASENKYLFILLPETPPEGGKKVYERIRNHIEKVITKNKLQGFIKFKMNLRCIPEEKTTTAQELIDKLLSGLEG